MADTSLKFDVFALDRASKTFIGLADRVERLSRKLDELDRKKADPRVDVDTRGAHRKIDALNNDLNKLSFRKAVVNVGVALGPGIVGAAAGIGGLAALTAGAGAGFVSFAATAVASMKNVTEARKELAKEDADHRAILQGLSAAQQQAIKDTDKLARSWSRFQEETDPAVLAAMGAGMLSLRNALPNVAPLVERSAGAFESLGVTVGQLTAGSQFSAWVEDLSDLAGDTLPELGAGAINAAAGLGRIVTAFGDMGRGAASGFAGWMRDFAEWTEGAGLAGFVRFSEQVAPQLVDTLGAVSSALLNLLKAAGPLASPLLAIVEAGANIVNTMAEIHPGLLTAAVAIASFTSASRLLGSGLISANIRMAAFKAHLAAVPTVAGKARAGIAHLAGAMGGKRGVAGAAGIAGLALGGMADTSTGTGKALSALGTTASGALLGFAVGGPIGAAIGGGAGALLGLGQAFLGAGDAAESSAGSNGTYTASLDKVSGAVTRTTRDIIAAELEKKNVLQELAGAGLDPGVGVEAVMGDTAAMDAVTRAFDTQLAAINRHREAIFADGKVVGEENDQLRDLNARQQEVIKTRKNTVGTIEQHRKTLKADQEQLRRTTEATDGYGRANRTARITTESLAHAVNRLTRAQHENAMQALLGSDKNLAFRQSMLDLNKEARRGKKTWDDNTQAGIDNRTAVNRSIASWNDLKAAQQNAGRKFEDTRRALIREAMQMGATRKQATEYIDRLMEKPDRIVTKAELERREAERDAEAWRRKLGGIPGIAPTTAKFESGKASSDVTRFIHTTKGKFRDLGNDVFAITVKGQSGFGRIPMATGGAVHGPGTGTSDDIPAMLSNGEHVITADEVRKAGGHGAILAIRRMLRRGEMGDVPAFAEGGPVGTVRTSVKTDFSSLYGMVSTLVSRIDKLLQFGGGRPLGPGGSLSPGQVVQGQRFAQSQQGKPYIWGGVGPAGYDCSGFQSAVYNSAVGRNPYSRLGSTGTMPWAGMRGGTGLYSIGWFTGNPGHMSGNIGGLGVESRGGDGVVVGGGARSPLDGMFNRVAHFDRGGSLKPGVTLARNDSGKDELVLTNAQAKVMGRQFRLGPNQSRRDVRGEFRELVRAFRDAFGKDSNLFKRLDRMEHWAENLAGKLQKLDRTNERLMRQRERLESKRNALAGSVRDQFRNDPFTGGLDDFSLQVRADRNDARRMKRALRKARAKGLGDGLLGQLAASGNFTLAQEFAGSSRKEINRLERFFSQRNQASRAVGNFAGNTVFGDELRKNGRELRQNNKATRRLTRVMEKNERTTERLVRQGGRHSNARQRARAR